MSGGPGTSRDEAPQIEQGLSEREAGERLRIDGPNELPSAKPRNAFALARDVVKEPMLLLLLGAGAVYLALGEPADSLILLASVLFVLAIGFVQKRKTERALESLRELSSPRALVVREGRAKRIAGRDVVRGDIVVLSEGDRVPADAVVLSCLNLAVDESLLSGESVPVSKSAGERSLPPARPGGDELPFVFSGTLIVQGHGTAEVRATGGDTEIGKIGRALGTLRTEPSTLEKETGRIVRVVASLAFAVCGLLAVLYGLAQGAG